MTTTPPTKAEHDAVVEATGRPYTQGPRKRRNFTNDEGYLEVNHMQLRTADQTAQRYRRSNAKAVDGE